MPGSTTTPRRLVPLVLAAAATAAATVLALVGAPAAASASDERSSGAVRGRVLSGPVPVRSAEVTLWAVPPSATPVRAERVGSDTAAANGSFQIARPTNLPSGSVLYLTADHGPGAQLAAVVPATIPDRVVVNEITTLAAGYAFAQFLDQGVVAGITPSLGNAAGMAADLADARTGDLGEVLRTAPNGDRTTTMRTFNTLANAIVPCIRDNARCGELLALTTPAGGTPPANSFAAVASIARHPSDHARELFALAQQARDVYRPTLAQWDAPDAWTIALRFDGDGSSLNGPGNFAIDAHGNVWVTANYTYSRSPFATVCGSKQLFEFTPDGRYASGSPYSGGGLDGAGFGITFDPDGHAWVGNFGFASNRCATPPLHNSVSEFTASGQALSPSTGFTQGGVSWPQGTVSDSAGNIRIANCGTDSITTYPSGNPAAASNTPAGVDKPFDMAYNGTGPLFVTGNGDNTVAVLNADGSPARAPITGGGLNRPLGIAADTHGNMWVANSGAVTIPCPDGGIDLAPRSGSITFLTSDGAAPPVKFSGGGVTTPWGIAVDGHNHVWVANFAGQRLSEFCGVDPSSCPTGATLGTAISPPQGYGFDGLTRNTGVAIDPSGNVWVANNWKSLPLPPLNPGGYQVVAFVGAAAPLRTPLIGPPTPLPGTITS